MEFWRLLQLFKTSTDILPQRYPLQVPGVSLTYAKRYVLLVLRQFTHVGGALSIFALLARLSWLYLSMLCSGVIFCCWVACSGLQLTTCQLTGMV